MILELLHGVARGVFPPEDGVTEVVGAAAGARAAAAAAAGAGGAGGGPSSTPSDANTPS